MKSIVIKSSGTGYQLQKINWVKKFLNFSIAGFQVPKKSMNSKRNFVMKNRVIRLPDVIKQTGLSRSTIYDYIKTGMFPKQIKLGIRAVGWYEDDIEKWLQVRAECRDVNASTFWSTHIEK